MILIVMGVSGAGKTRIGELLAERLGCSFVDGDEFHSAANKEKMAQGIALTDEDRWPWLAAIRAAIEAKVRAGQSLIVGCSSFELLHERLATRGRHFFNPALLQSQLDTLEEPGEDEAITVGIELAPEAIVDEVVAKLD